MGLAMTPGWTELTRTPRPPTSSAAGADAIPDARQVDVEDPAMALFVLILDTDRRDTDPGIVDQHIQPAEGLLAKGDVRGPLRCICDVETDPGCVDTKLRRKCPAFRLQHVRHQNPCARGNKKPRDALTLATPAPAMRPGRSFGLAGLDMTALRTEDPAAIAPPERGRDHVTKEADGSAVDIAHQFQVACLELAEPDLAAVELLPTLLARACAKVLHVAGAGISAFAEDFRVPLGASDPDAAIAEQLQFTHGEGPCLEAYRTGEPFRGDRESIKTKWPLFYDELATRTDYHSIVSLPLRLSHSTGGAVDLYQHQSDDVDALRTGDMTIVIGRIVDALSWQTAPKAVGVPGPGWLHGPIAQSRTRVWVAIGMLRNRYDLTAPDALARLRSYAYAHDQTLDDVAEQLVRDKLPLSHLRP
jgi:ANTAR domain